MMWSVGSLGVSGMFALALWRTGVEQFTGGWFVLAGLFLAALAVGYMNGREVTRCEEQ
jgi:hypothetical protein